MKGYITLARKIACIKLGACTGATYFFQLKDGFRYTREVSDSEVVRAFRGNEKMRLRIRLEDSLHVIYSVKNRAGQAGYEVRF